MEFVKKNRKKILIGIIIIAFLTLVGAVQVIRVVGGNILKAVNGETEVESNGDITSLSSSDAKKIVDNAEKELKAKEEADKKLQDSEKKIFEAKVNAAKANESKLVQLPSSDIVPNTNFDRHGTLGVAKIDDNYYVGYYCGLEQVWDATIKANNRALVMKILKDRGEMNNEEYQQAAAELKGYSPYIKKIQDMDMKTADPKELQKIVYEYALDTIRMNMRYADSNIVGQLTNGVFAKNDAYLTDAIYLGKRTTTGKESEEYLYKLDDNKYPALNKNMS
ncbi:hypothetical protein [Clostridium sp. C2-6-12]|uniref:hypothetical protein n=1 Tax=Clostridium sp. C2-6-12 TaxID=2698832 RepID=UPI001369FE3C|nr:hypothetical protein [Clostridium sp. C2-6-12]